MTPPKKLLHTKGHPPGTAIYTGASDSRTARMELFCYNEQDAEKTDSLNWENIAEKFNPEKTNWININSISNVKLIEEIGKHFELHALLIEDIVTVDMLPKAEEYDGHLYISIKMLSVNEEKNLMELEQVSFVLGKNYLLSFQENEGDVLDPIRDRILNNKGRVRRKKSDYLLLTLIDVVVDNYLTVLEYMQEKIQKLEEELLTKAAEDTERKILKLRKQLIMLRKNIFPLRDVLRQLLRDEPEILEEINLKYYRDVSDHLNYTCETLDGFKETMAGLLDLYRSNLNNKLNNIMKMLTIVSTIFIPLTFIAGIYGMNFEYMPELGYKYSYPITLIIMFIIGFSMFWFIWRKKWL